MSTYSLNSLNSLTTYVRKKTKRNVREKRRILGRKVTGTGIHHNENGSTEFLMKCVNFDSVSVRNLIKSGTRMQIFAQLDTLR